MNKKNKVITLDSLKKRISLLRREGKRIAFTNGCFDILHYGHVNYLAKAKKNNRILIVGLNSDSSVKNIKGAKRPIFSEKERAGVLAALEAVDYVTIFNEDTPLEVIKALKPDVLIKGADWQGKEIAGGHFVKNYGGKVEFIKFVDGFSSTHAIESIVNLYGRK